jgi:hypothetical protein
MKVKLTLLVPLFLNLVFTHTSFANESTEALVRKAVSENANESTLAIAELRSQGPAGLKALRERYVDEIERHIADPSASTSVEWQRIAAALDAVSQQKDSYISGLFWYTDIREARKASRDSGKPILSLRLLGKLNEEFSCANSRFFRTVLYSNADVAKTLREQFILHWQSVRPAPRVTIDFGDGRKLERTVTGNSIHYILDSQGRPIDALPGLYAPQAFLRGLAEAGQAFKDLQGKDNTQRQNLLATYQRAQIKKISFDWYTDIAQIGGKAPQGFAVEQDHHGQAIAIAPLAVTKMVTEASILRSIIQGAELLGKMTDEPAWTKIALLHLKDAKLDERSIGLIKRQTQGLLNDTAGGLDPAIRLDNLLQTFQRSIALDTVRNEYMLRTKLFGWLLVDPSRNDIDKLNEKVYAELFLTPRSDAWLGLFSPETYTALDHGGVVNNREQ